jgi:aminoglycoside 2''-phosphotransferase
MLLALWSPSAVRRPPDGTFPSEVRSAASAVRAIRRHCPDVAVRSIEELPHYGWGGDSDAFLINRELIFRFPRWPHVARALEVEARLLPLLRPRVPIRIPDFRYLPRHRRTGRPLFCGYAAIPGRPMAPEVCGQLASSSPTLEHMAAQLGGFLSGLHTFPLEQATGCGVEIPTVSVRDQVARAYSSARERLHPILVAGERTFLDTLYTTYLDDPRHFAWPPALCHGDLTSDHILALPPEHPDVVSEGITGIIDFGDVRVGDPAGDFVWRFEYGDTFFNRVLDHYMAPLPDREAFARVVAVRYQLMATAEIGYGLQIGNAEYVDEGRRVLREHMSRT